MAAVQTVKYSVNKDKCQWKLPSKAPTPMVSSFVPELDGTTEVVTYGHRFFQIDDWDVEMGN